MASFKGLCQVGLEGAEADDAFLSNGQRGHRLFGYPRVGAGQMIAWTADWVRRGGRLIVSVGRNQDIVAALEPIRSFLPVTLAG